MLQIAIEPKSKADNDKMGAALYKLAQEDPSFHFSRDDETNQTVIEGMGELHLDIIVDRMKREFNVAADIGAPQVCCSLLHLSCIPSSVTLCTVGNTTYDTPQVGYSRG